MKHFHRCMWPGCDVTILLSQWGCRAHWFTLPPVIRGRISVAYRDGLNDGTHPTQRYVEAHAAALRWIELNGSQMIQHAQRRDERARATEVRCKARKAL